MEDFEKERQTANVEPGILLESDDDYGAKYQLIDVSKQQQDSDSDSSDYPNRNKNLGPYGYKEKKFAKPTEELRSDIMELFHQQELWTWQQIKESHLSDQPEAPLKKQVQELCDKVSGNGNAARYKLKEALKM